MENDLPYCDTLEDTNKQGTLSSSSSECQDCVLRFFLIFISAAVGYALWYKWRSRRGHRIKRAVEGPLDFHAAMMTSLVKELYQDNDTKCVVRPTPTTTTRRDIRCFSMCMILTFVRK